MKQVVRHSINVCNDDLVRRNLFPTVFHQQVKKSFSSFNIGSILQLVQIVLFSKSAMLPILILITMAITASAQSAKIVAYCDNVLYVHTNQGTSKYTYRGTSTDWKTPFELEVYADTLTGIRFECRDQGYIGGFIATVTYKGQTYSTKPNSKFGILEGQTTNLKYTAQNSGPWNLHTRSPKVASDAQWVCPFTHSANIYLSVTFTHF